MKQDRLGLSFGYLIEDEREGPDGAKEILSLDLAEFKLTCTPANPGTRVPSTKALEPLQIATFEIR